MKNQKLMRNSLFLLLAVTVLFAGCKQINELEDVDRIDYDAEYAVPLINTSVSIQDILEEFEDDASLIIDPDGQIRFHYRGDVLTQNSDDIFESINQALGFPIELSEHRMPLPVDLPNDMMVDRMDLKKGRLTYGFRNPYEEPLSVTLRFPEVTKNGNVLSFQFNMPAWDGVDEEYPLASNLIAPASLEGYRIVPVNDSIFIEYEALLPGGDNVEIPAGIILEDIEIGYAEGYLGNQLHEGGRDTIEIDFFENYLQGNIYFADPVISFDIENSFGIPTRSVVNIFEVLTVNGEILPLESPYIENGIDFPYPTIDEIGVVKTERFTFDKNNSNIDVVLGSGPTALDYDVDALTNPDSITSIRGFITDSSYYKVQVEVDLPLYGQAIDFIAQDTFEINFSDYEDVSRAEFKLVTENALPLSVDIQGYFVDDNDVVLDSLLDSQQRVIAPAPVDSEGYATSAVEQVTYAPYSADRFAKIRSANRLMIVAGFSTYNDGNVSVRILATQEVQVKLGAILELDN